MISKLVSGLVLGPVFGLLVLAPPFVWKPQAVNTDASLRGLRVVSSKVVWASGTKGTFLMTSDGGAHWRAGVVPDAGALDFRDVEAFDADTAYLLAIGEGEKSRLYKTADGGGHWHLLFTNPDAKGFFDALAFWDRAHGILLGDPVNGHFAIFTTGDGGVSWQRQQTPAALTDEGAFAASGTCLVVQGGRNAWFGTGGPGAGRVFRTADGGRTWSVAETPLRFAVKSGGIFSLAFRDGRHGIAVGGDYEKPQESSHAIALTDDGGISWRALRHSGLSGYRSAVVFLPKSGVAAVGTGGSDFSPDDGETWQAFAGAGFNAVSAAGDKVWAAGAKGALAELVKQPHL